MDSHYKRVMMGGGLGIALLVGMMMKETPEESRVQRTVTVQEGHSHEGGPGHELLAEGTAAPDFRLPMTDGKTLGPEDLRGSYSILLFVTPTCPYCKELKTRLLDRDVPVKDRLIFITPGGVDPEKLSAEQRKVEAHVAAAFPVLSDRSRTIAGEYNAAAVPTAYLLDEEGRIAGAGLGVEEGMALVERLLEKSS